MFLEKVFQKIVASLGQNGFRVELHALDSHGLVADPHDFAIVGPGCDIETIRTAFPLDS